MHHTFLTSTLEAGERVSYTPTTGYDGMHCIIRQAYGHLRTILILSVPQNSRTLLDNTKDHKLLTNYTSFSSLELQADVFLGKLIGPSPQLLLPLLAPTWTCGRVTPTESITPDETPVVRSNRKMEQATQPTRKTMIPSSFVWLVKTLRRSLSSENKVLTETICENFSFRDRNVNWYFTA